MGRSGAPVGRFGHLGGPLGAWRATPGRSGGLPGGADLRTSGRPLRANRRPQPGCSERTCRPQADQPRSRPVAQRRPAGSTWALQAARGLQAGLSGAGLWGVRWAFPAGPGADPATGELRGGCRPAGAGLRPVNRCRAALEREPSNLQIAGSNPKSQVHTQSRTVISWKQPEHSATSRLWFAVSAVVPLFSGGMTSRIRAAVAAGAGARKRRHPAATAAPAGRARAF